MPKPVNIADLTPRTKTIYPKPFAATTNGRAKRALGNLFDLTQFGVNHTTLAPKASSALRHYHTYEDELVYVLAGTPTLEADEGQTELRPGDVIGFRGGETNGHRIINLSDEPAEILEVGTRRPDLDEAEYPDADLRYVQNPDAGEGKPQRVFIKRDGTRY
ncbi:MAG: cupin domain-containing protein [Pseudomonadota bacterium]